MLDNGGGCSVHDVLKQARYQHLRTFSQKMVRLTFSPTPINMFYKNYLIIHSAFFVYVFVRYTESYFPKFSEYASKELNDRARQRARSSDMLGSILDKMRSTWVDMTSGIQSQMVYEYDYFQ